MTPRTHPLLLTLIALVWVLSIQAPAHAAGRSTDEPTRAALGIAVSRQITAQNHATDRALSFPESISTTVFTDGILRSPKRSSGFPICPRGPPG